MAARPPKKPVSETYSGRFAARLRELRMRKKLSVKDLAAKITDAGFDVAEKTVYHWETGRSSPHLDALPAIAEALGKTTRTLLPE